MKQYTKIKYTILLFYSQYLQWRVLMGYHHSIKLSFLPVGHTKFSPDWCFGLLKQRFRRTKVDCLDDLVQVVESSAAINNAQLVGTQSGEVIVPTFDWADFLSKYYKKIPDIKVKHHFLFTVAKKGVVITKKNSDSDEEEHHILQTLPSIQAFPKTVAPKGLNEDRQWYLYNKIRQFCSEETKDIVCPLPVVNQTSVTAAQSQSEFLLKPVITTSPSPTHSPPMKRKRMCRQCGQTGHNMRTLGFPL